MNKFVRISLGKFQNDSNLVSIGVLDVDDSYDVVRAVAPLWDKDKIKLEGLVLTEERFETRIIEGIETIIDEFQSLKPELNLLNLVSILFLFFLL